MSREQFSRKVDDLMAHEPGKYSVEQAIAQVASEAK